MKHLVLGGAGFIGSHLCDRLVEDGGEVVALDNFFSGRRDNVAHLEGCGRFELVRGDACEPYHYEVDRVWNLACPAAPLHYAKNKVRTIKTAVLGTMRALELAREVGARMLTTSTSEVYGSPTVCPQPEEYWGNVNPVGLSRSCYDEGKRCGEAMIVAWNSQYGTDARIARIFNTYGPRLASGDGRIIPNFVTQALSMPIGNFVFTETTPNAVGTAVSSKPVTNAASYLPPGVAGPLDDYESIEVVAELIGATGGTLDVYVQQNPTGDGVTWFDIVHFTQLGAGAGAVKYEASISLFNNATTPVTIGKNLSPALSAGSNINGPFSDRIRLLFVAGTSTSAGANITVTVCAQRQRSRELGGS